MKITFKAQKLIEWIGIKANLVPVPTGAILMATVCKAILVAFKFEIFEAAQDSPCTIEQIAQRTKLDSKALRGLMNILMCAGYFKYKDNKFNLTKMAKKWCLRESPENVYNMGMYHNEVMLEEINHLEEYLKTGKGLDIHEKYSEEQWELYQKGMLDLARATARSAPKMMPNLSNPTKMLDIGGSHGIYCIEMCKKYSTLKATILDLPQAVEKAGSILKKFNMKNRINYQPGNALTDDLGENKYDLILISSVMHHFSEKENIIVSQKAAKALKPGGYFAIQDWLRPTTSPSMEMVGAIMDVCFNLQSTSETWGLDELKHFQHKAGLIHYKVKYFMEVPGFVQISAKKG